MIGGRSKPVYEEQAKERHEATLPAKGKKGTTSNARENLPTHKHGRARDKAAEAVKVSGKLVDAASTVLKSGDTKLIAAVDAGEVSVTKAAKQVKPPKTKPLLKSPKSKASQ